MVVWVMVVVWVVCGGGGVGGGGGGGGVGGGGGGVGGVSAIPSFSLRLFGRSATRDGVLHRAGRIRQCEYYSLLRYISASTEGTKGLAPSSFYDATVTTETALRDPCDQGWGEMGLRIRQMQKSRKISVLQLQLCLVQSPQCPAM